MANTDKFGTMMQCIPISSLIRLGKIFKEGLRYGRNNWKNNPDADFVEERTNHAIIHLMKFANGDRSEDHLAKLMWFASTTIEILEKYSHIDSELQARSNEVGKSNPTPIAIVSEAKHPSIGQPVFYDSKLGTITKD
jgi:hypothetical protein